MASDSTTHPAPTGSPEPSGSGRRDPGYHTPQLPPFLVANRVTLIAGAITLALAAFVYFGMPHSRNIAHLGEFLVKLTPFVSASIAIGWLHVGWAHRLRLHLILPPLCFTAFFAYFVPKLFFYANLGADFGQFYYTMLMLVPFIILTIALMMRLGGAARSTVLRMAAALMLIQLSGIEDLAFLTVNDLTGTAYHPIPEVWEWADHMTVRLGHPASKYEAFAFIAVHLTAAVLVLTLPGRWFRALGQRLRRRTS
ncbi:MAG TPA: hypothetical protein VKZ67_12315 [Natronosporangium sp.]|nr:hypothetical protein [Natronosporangium sp.]